VGIRIQLHSSSTASGLRHQKHDESRLLSQCADAPVFKMPRLAKGAFYHPTQKTVLICWTAKMSLWSQQPRSSCVQARSRVGQSAVRDRVRMFKGDKESFGLEKARARIMNFNQRGRPFCDPKPSFKQWMVDETHHGRAVGRQEIQEDCKLLDSSKFQARSVSATREGGAWPTCLGSAPRVELVRDLTWLWRMFAQEGALCRHNRIR